MKYLYFYIFFLIFSNSQLHADDSIEKIGDVLQIGLPATALYMTFLKDDINGRVSFWESLLSSTMITISLKKTLYKKRPDASNYESFPSGHTTVAFSGASFITYRYGTFSLCWSWAPNNIYLKTCRLLLERLVLEKQKKKLIKI